MFSNSSSPPCPLSRSSMSRLMPNLTSESFGLEDSLERSESLSAWLHSNSEGDLAKEEEEEGHLLPLPPLATNILSSFCSSPPRPSPGGESLGGLYTQPRYS